MLLYDETYRAGYGEYGMFLFRTGKKEAGQALWTEYKSKETMLDDTVSSILLEAVNNHTDKTLDIDNFLSSIKVKITNQIGTEQDILYNYINN